MGKGRGFLAWGTEVCIALIRETGTMRRLVLRMFEKKGLNLKKRAQGLWYDVVGWLRSSATSFYHWIIFEIMNSASSATKKGRKSRAKVRRRAVKEASVRRWLRRARAKGMRGPGLVHELHVRRGMSLPKVARVLRLRPEVVRRHWRKSCAERAAAGKAAKPPRVLPPLVPQSEEDVAALRERVGLALWETVVASFGEGTGKSEGGDGAVGQPPSMALASVRLRALRQMGRLYGVSIRKRGKRGGRVAEVGAVGCATPEEIAGLVRERLRSRGGQVEGEDADH